MEARQPVDVGVTRVVQRRVVAEHDHFDTLQAHDAIGLRPAAVIADAHAHHPAEAAPDTETQIAGFEIAFLKMLVGAVRLRFGMAGKVDLAVLADDLGVPVDEDGGVEAALAALLR